MALTRWRRPQALTLPGGYRIEVRYTRKGVDGVYGFWESDRRRITINAREPLWQQAYAFAHELQHALVDYQHWINEYVVDPMKEEAETTLLEEVE